MPRILKHSYETKVAACADYLLGLSIAEIEFKYKVSGSLVYYWIRKRGCFKLRQKASTKPNRVGKIYAVR
jgi:transposase-like protein